MKFSSLTIKKSLLKITKLVVLWACLYAPAAYSQEVQEQPEPVSEQTKPTSKIFDLQLDEEEDSEDESTDSEEINGTEPEEEAQVVDNRTTAEKLEDLKGEVLAVNRDLFILEEDLLFPASTQLATYFSIDIGYFFELDNIKVKIDDEQVTHHLYTIKDVNALKRGAIQKLHLDNISTGEHELVAILIGTGPKKREYRRAVSFKFEKGTEAKALEIQLRDDIGKLQPKLNVVEW
ncbi:MAG: AraC family transcriptional regulator [Kangiellaceae bacterium]|nr:AraC family transcriptional regulator [Kangiellaceae bacterium]